MADPAELVQRYWFDVWGRYDLDALAEIITDPYVRHGPEGTRTSSVDDLRRDLIQYQRSLHKPDVTIHHQTVDGDMVWTSLTARGPSVDSGDVLVVSWLQLHRVEDDRLAEVWALYASGHDWGKR